jgi:salicylate hydroxylase
MDGIRSTVRKSVLAHQGTPDSPSVEPVWGGTVVYRGLVGRDVLDRVFPGHRASTTPMMVSLIYVCKIGFAADEEMI